METAKKVFAEYQANLEDSPELFALRLFTPTPDGGAFWRNKASRDYYTTRGFFPAPVMSWAVIKQYLTPKGLAEIEQHAALAFETGEPVDFIHHSYADPADKCQSVTRFLAVHGNQRAGVLLTHLQPLPAEVELSLEQLEAAQRAGT
jgi:hypothetical protein